MKKEERRRKKEQRRRFAALPSVKGQIHPPAATRPPHRMLVELGILLLLVGGCAGGETAETTTATSAVVDPTSTIAATTTAPPTTTAVAPTPAPLELRGVWVTELSTGDEVRLTLQETSYTIERPPNRGSGRISVKGNTIEFYAAAPCPDGRGMYAWVIAGETLSLTLVGEDPCGREPVLNGISYTLLSRLP